MTSPHESCGGILHCQLLDWVRYGPVEYIINEDPALPPVLLLYKDFFKPFVSDYYRSDLCTNFLMIPMEGSQTYAWAKTEVFQEFAFPEPGMYPFVLGWRYGKGYTWSLSGTIFLQFAREYGPDVIFAMLMYSTGRELPEKVVMVHKLRGRFSEYADGKSYVISMTDFVEKFGANTNPMMVKVYAMDDRWKEARHLYLGQNYEGCWTLLDQVLIDIDSFREKALKLKDETLFWIYVSEWLITTGTFLFASFVVWSLMVRRHLYREVGSTRLRLQGILS